jgi:hypothetical protein
MRITVDDTTVNYDMEYLCDWPKGSSSLQSTGEDNVQSSIVNHISTKSYSNTVENVYLFYTPSIFLVEDLADIALLNNLDNNNAVNFYVAKQDIVSRPIKIVREGNNISAYADVAYSSYLGDNAESGDGSVNRNKVVKTKPKDRIYDVKIDICKYVDTDDVTQKYHEVEYSLDGTIEE